MRTLSNTLLASTLLVLLLAPLASAGHSIERTSGKATPGDHTMTVDVKGFTLVPFAGKSGAEAHKKGEGHIHYLVNGAPAPGDYATTATTFTFKDLKAGDRISAELVLSDHSPSGTDASGTLDGSRVLTAEATVSEKAMGIPGASPVLVLGLLVALAVASRRL